MKPKLKNIIFLILISGTIISCHCKDTYQYVPDENKIIYQQDELIIFKSNLGNCDTFRINIEKSYDNIDSGPCGLLAKQQTNYKESITTNYIKIKNNKIEGYINQFINYENNSFWWENTGTNTYDQVYNVLYDSLLINNQMYYQVYYDSTLKPLTSSTTNLKDLYFHIKYGILKYTFKTGEVWSIQN